MKESQFLAVIRLLSVYENKLQRHYFYYMKYDRRFIQIHNKCSIFEF